MKQYDFSLNKLKEVWKGVPDANCEEHLNAWMKFGAEGETLTKHVEFYLENNPEGNFSLAFGPVIHFFEVWFKDDFPGRKNQNYELITPMLFPVYDLLVSLRRSYTYRSAATSNIILRTLFEAKVNFAEILRNPIIFPKQFSNYKRVAILWHDYREGVITKESLIEQMKSYPEWYDDDWKTMKSKKESWTGIAFDSLAKMAERNNFLDEYKTVYRAASEFTHMSPLIATYYKKNGNCPISDTKGVFQMSYIGLNFAIESLLISFRIVGLDLGSLNDVLKLPFYIISQEDNFLFGPSSS